MLTDGLVAAAIVEGQVVAMQINDRMRYNGEQKVPEGIVGICKNESSTPSMMTGENQGAVSHAGQTLYPPCEESRRAWAGFQI